MEHKLSLSLKLLALFFLWYVAVFLLSVASLNGINIPAPAFRGSEYMWDFELFFAAIYAVWGIYVWKASSNPNQHLFFIDFTLWATFAHIVAMIAVGFVRTEDLAHLLLDAGALAMPLVLVAWFRKVKQ